MSRIGSLLSLATLALAAPATGQTSQSVAAPATVEIIARPLTLVLQSGLDFGSHFASEGVISLGPLTGAASSAQWNGQTDPGANISIAFNLPPQLTRDGGGDFVPISYGSQSAYVGHDLQAIAFDPAEGVSSFPASSSDGRFEVGLGANSGSEAHVVSVDLTGRQPGTYRGTITLTVAVL